METPPLVPNLVPTKTATTLGSSDLPKTLAHLGTEILQILLLLGGVVAVLYLLYAGFRYVTSGGDAEKAKSARAGIFSSIVGVIIIASAFALVHFGIRIGSFVSDGAGTKISANDGSNNDVINQPKVIKNPTDPNVPVINNPVLAPVTPDTYPFNGPGYAMDVIKRCAGTDNPNYPVTQSSCYSKILDDHDNFCASVANAPSANFITSRYCSGKTHDEADKDSYCQDLLAAEEANGSQPYAECVARQKANRPS